MREFLIRMAEEMDDIDARPTPVTRGPPLKTGVPIARIEPSLDVRNERSWRFVPSTETCIVAGRSAMSAFLRQGASGLPVGTHFLGKTGADARLRRMGRPLGDAAPRVRRHPPYSP